MSWRALALLAAGVAFAGCGNNSRSEPRAAPPEVPRGESVLLNPAPELAASPAPFGTGQLVQELVACTSRKVDMKVLIVAATGDEPSLAAIKQTLEYLGTPYRVIVASRDPAITPATLSNGCRALYQAVFLTNGDVAFDDGGTWRGALDASERAALTEFEAAFKIREVSLYTYPTSAWGFAAGTPISTDSAPLAANLTAEGLKVFPYLKGRLEIRYAWTYLAAPLDAATVPLLVDAEGHALMARRTLADGREILALTFDHNPWLNASVAIGYGLVRWATRGVFLGERHVYLGAQVDDLLIPDDLWPNSVDWRMRGDDLRAVAAWQDARRARPTTAGFRLDFAYNGEGTDAEMYPNDTLVPAVYDLEWKFKWINHTYSHLNLDAVNATEATNEIKLNFATASTLGFAEFDRSNMVTPDVSGLQNYAFLKAAYAQGVRYLVCDTSKGCVGKWPNAAVYNPLYPAMVQLPRYPTNLFYNVSTPAEWTGEYNQFYRSYWGRDLTYEELLDKESAVLLSYLIKGDANPLMFHQANLRAYDGKRTLLGDLLDATFAKYDAIYTLPIQSPTMEVLGDQMERRFEYRSAAVTATWTPGTPGTVTFYSDNQVLVPVTGMCRKGSERYGGDCIHWANVPAYKNFTLTLQ